jgi:hypothetical protein
MGSVQSVQKPANAGPTVDGEWKNRFSTGYQYVTPNVISGPEVTKIAGPGGSEIWGPFRKLYTKALWGEVFTPPANIDGVPVLCRCRDIKEYVRNQSVGLGYQQMNLGAQAALVFGKNRPACWEDRQTIMDPTGGPTYNLTLGHPAFYGYTLNRGGIIGAATGFRGFGGLKKTKGNNKRKTKKARSTVLAI